MNAVRAVNGSFFFRPASSPPLTILRRSRSCHGKTFLRSRCCKSGVRLPKFRCDAQSYADSRSSSLHSLVDLVIEELKAFRILKQHVCSAIKLTSSGELLDDKLLNQPLEKGMLLEFKKDAGRVLLAVALRPDGKKNWMVYDQALEALTKKKFQVLSRKLKTT